jgi:hypothetical protein
MYLLFYYDVPDELKAIDPKALIYVSIEYSPEAEKELLRLRGRYLGVFKTIQEATAKRCQHTLSLMVIESVN